MLSSYPKPLHKPASFLTLPKRSLCLLGIVLLFTSHSLMSETMVENVASDFFKFIKYNTDTEILEASLVTPSIKGELLIKNDHNYQLLPESRLDNLFSMRIKIACHLLSSPSTLLWIPQHGHTQKINIPRQNCVKNDINKTIKIYKHKQLGCVIDTAGSTLWRTAVFIRKYNGGTIHQNMYAIFLMNKDKFTAHDIHRMNDTTLRCPSPRLVVSIDDSQVKSIFKDTLK